MYFNRGSSSFHSVFYFQKNYPRDFCEVPKPDFCCRRYFNLYFFFLTPGLNPSMDRFKNQESRLKSRVADRSKIHDFSWLFFAHVLSVILNFCQDTLLKKITTFWVRFENFTRTVFFFFEFFFRMCCAVHYFKPPFCYSLDPNCRWAWYFNLYFAFQMRGSNPSMERSKNQESRLKFWVADPSKPTTFASIFL